jgi:hypothetical protein
VESELSAEGLFSDLVVFGDAQPYCVALLSPRDPALGDDDLQRAVDRRNARLPDYARVLNWYRLPQPLAATGELLTDNGRPRRAAIEARYAGAIETLYREGPRSNPDYARTA